MDRNGEIHGSIEVPRKNGSAGLTGLGSDTGESLERTDGRARDGDALVSSLDGTDGAAEGEVCFGDGRRSALTGPSAPLAGN